MFILSMESFQPPGRLPLHAVVKGVKVKGER